MNYVKAAGIKKFVQSEGLRVGKDAIEQLDRKIHGLLVEAVQAAKMDRRATMHGEDIK